ncbi:MAG TPA: CCA tRNA nucleotidyltransferase [Rhizobium sp.]|nr:CCA tRNA nucleotidyltransferase [Rhizobium sp.]
MTNLSQEPWFRDPALIRVMDLLNAEGGEGRVAGGAIRNSLMGLPVADIDIATTLEPEEVTARAKAAGIKSVPTGIDHGTVTLVVDGKPFEVTTLRHDVETDGRRATVKFGADWQADAERRDLTINALYVDRAGEVIDLVNGLPDVETRTVRFIGDADKRIAEDYLRILRFFRFFAHYGAGRPDAEGLKACMRARGKLATLSAERVWSELKKLLKASDPSRALLWMRQAGVLTEILPETEKWGIDAIHGLVAAEQALGWHPDPMLRLAAIVPKDAARLAAMAERLRMSKAEARFLDHFARAPKPDIAVKDAAFDRDLYHHGREGLTTILKLELATVRAKGEADPAVMARVARLSALLKRAEAFEKPTFPVSGAHLLAAGIPPGPAVGKALKALESEWVAGNFSMDRARLLARLKEMSIS